MCVPTAIRDLALDDLGQCVEVLDGLLRTRVRVPEKNRYVFFCKCLNTAIELVDLGCDYGYYQYIKNWYDFSHIIMEHDYWKFQNPVDLTKE